MKGESDNMWMENFVASFNMLSSQFPGITVENLE